MLDLSIEALLIVFSVMLALAANRWRDQHAAQQRLIAAEQHIRIELENNRAILLGMIPYHEAEVRRIGQFLARSDLSEQIRGHSFHDLEGELMPRGVWNPTVSPKDLLIIPIAQPVIRATVGAAGAATGYAMTRHSGHGDRAFRPSYGWVAADSQLRNRDNQERSFRLGVAKRSLGPQRIANESAIAE